MPEPKSNRLEFVISTNPETKKGEGRLVSEQAMMTIAWVRYLYARGELEKKAHSE
jgi:hypothetical protein